jgi:virginiamycin B lyase
MRIGIRLLGLLWLAATGGAGGQDLQLQEWRVPWENSRPRDPFVAPDGRVWFVGQAGNYIAVLDPNTGGFRRYEIDPGTYPHNLIVAPDGKVWYAGNQIGMIGRLDPVDGSIVRYPMPAGDLTDPHTQVFDAAGNIWFTMQASNAIGFLTVRTGEVRVVRLPNPGSRPYGIGLDGTGRPWFAEFGANRIGTVDPVSLTLREYSLPDAGSRPRRLVVAGDNRIYVTDYARGKLVRLDPGTGAFSEWQNPAGARSAPYAMAGDDRGRIWQVETGVQPNRLVSFDPATEHFGTPIPITGSGGVVVRHMIFDRGSRSLWFGTDAGTIGRARLGPSGGAAAPVP